ncbi:HD domain-containing protein [Candidatus Saganbacteria bacterium]|nr:HD domain-containing protein [Candidatus Saganbacteria bacterium]
MKERLLLEMENYFGRDEKRKDHARRVLGYAEQMLINEAGDREVVVAAAILHDIGIHAAEKKYGSSAGKYQEIEGPPIAENILKKLSFPEEKIAEVLQIIAHHHSGGVDTLNFKILQDADRLVNRQGSLGSSANSVLRRNLRLNVAVP